MVSSCADLTLSTFLYLTVRSPIWSYNYRSYICHQLMYAINMARKCG